MTKVVHFTSVHKRYDVRIFLKECVSLAQAGHEVYLVVADGLGDEVKSGVSIVDAGRPHSSRMKRMLYTAKRVFSKAVGVGADVYHFHDPELLPFALKIKKKRPRAKVFFDSHENYAHDIEDKSYIPALVRPIVAAVYRSYERYAVGKLDAVIAATPAIRKHFQDLGVYSIDINNFPFENEFSKPAAVEEKMYDVAYIGAISRVRGVRFLVDASAVQPKKKIIMAGTIESNQFENELRGRPGWSNVEYIGQVDRSKIQEVLSSSRVAAVTFLPAANHVESQPNKMFEYMSGGIPVVASDFPLWKEIVEGNGCGICVDPRSPMQISSAIDKIAGDKEMARKMGENGRNAVLKKYNWRKESEKLLCFYDEFLG